MTTTARETLSHGPAAPGLAPPPQGPAGHGVPVASALSRVAPDAVVLRVDETTFTRADVERTLLQAAALAGVPPEMVDASMRQAFEQPAYEKLIERTLLVQEAKRRGLWPAADEVQRAAEEMKKTLPEGKTLDDVLHAIGVDEPAFLDDVRCDVALGKLLSALQAEVPAPSDAIVDKLYADNQSRFTIPDVAEAAHILVKVDQASDAATVAAKRDQALSILGQVKNQDAATFARVAAEKSDDPSGPARGGDLGAFQKDDLPAALAALAFSLGDGEVGGPVRTEQGFHVVRGGGITRGRVVPAPEAKKLLAERHKTRAFMEKVDDTVDSLRAAARIERVVEPAASPLVDENNPGSRVPSWRASALNALGGVKNPHGRQGEMPLPLSR
jgi:parvulin-like peptidyl-prolyl isomerase